MVATFSHPNYTLRRDGTLVRKPGAGKVSTSDQQNAEDASVIEAVTEYVQDSMRRILLRALSTDVHRSLGLVEHWIPDAEEESRCNIFLSSLDVSTKLLLILQNQVSKLLAYPRARTRR